MHFLKKLVSYSGIWNWAAGVTVMCDMCLIFASSLRDLSMILCDPFAINTLALSTIRHLQDLVGQDTLPRVSVAAHVPGVSLSELNSIHQQKTGNMEEVSLSSLVCVCKLKEEKCNTGFPFVAHALELCRSTVWRWAFWSSELTTNSLHGSFCPNSYAYTYIPALSFHQFT